MHLTHICQSWQCRLYCCSDPCALQSLWLSLPGWKWNLALLGRLNSSCSRPSSTSSLHCVQIPVALHRQYAKEKIKAACGQPSSRGYEVLMGSHLNTVDNYMIHCCTDSCLGGTALQLLYESLLLGFQAGQGKECRTSAAALPKYGDKLAEYESTCPL